MVQDNNDLYDALYRDFRWQVPPVLNIGELCCSRWAREAPERVAILYEHEDGHRTQLTYGELQARANRLSHALERLGVGPGDRIAIVMPQRLETAIAHIAAYQLGAVAMPLSMLFGPDALEYRLQDSEARVAIADESSIENLCAARTGCPALQHVIAAGAATGRGDMDWDAMLVRETSVYVGRATKADDPAVLIYTSGTTGPPKGALIPHRALIGNLPGFTASQNWFGFPPPSSGPLPSGKGERGMGGVNEGPPAQSAGDQIFWSPADWAWTGGLMDALLPTLYFGRTIVAYQGRFSAEKAYELMQRYRVTHTFLFPTALKAMMKAVPEPRRQYDLALQAIMSAGEAVGDAVFAYGQQQLGITINEMFGQTEMNYIVGNGSACWPARPGSMGRPYPGHRVAVIDDQGHPCPPGTPGDVAVHRCDIHGDPDPVFFLGYWRNDGATRAKFTGDPDNSWCRTGDTAVMDEDGYLWYQGRSDDVFKAAGYRIGPSEIENCLVKHPAVANAAVVPKPDAERGAVVKAYVVLACGHAGDDALVHALQQHVKGKLAPYEYPKEIEFIDALPMTTTGKVQRRVLRLREEERAAAKR
ncbi:AMP-binding protein [Schlegelella sp. S2-27]|uniref:AMP-binding protein n=1 Tax=Caldimonas mangrovi TaxID=2944811 RepID=A0ABT0YL49_9BURK|nr:AMP-binding protein [Caldimonas mangrovi]MCM5679460.1 AMP-binding protein [Caldimonas mangrovi]